MLVSNGWGFSSPSKHTHTYKILVGKLKKKLDNKLTLSKIESLKQQQIKKRVENYMFEMNIKLKKRIMIHYCL